MSLRCSSAAPTSACDRERATQTRTTATGGAAPFRRAEKEKETIMTAGVIPQYVDVNTLSERTGIAKSTLRQWIAEKRLPAHKALGGQVRIKVEDALAIFEQI